MEVRITVTLYASTPTDLVNDLERLGYQTGEVKVLQDDALPPAPETEDPGNES